MPSVTPTEPMKKLLPNNQAVAAALILLFAGIFATTDVSAKAWTGNVSTDWNDPGNWNPVGVPTASDNINFFTFDPAVVTTININSGTNAVAKSFDVLMYLGSNLIMNINAGASLTLNGGGAQSRGFAFKLYSGSMATITNNGTLTVENYTSRNVYLYNQSDAALTFTNNGTMTVSDCGTYAMHIDVNGGATFGASNSFTNTGTLNISDGSQYAMYISGFSSRPSYFTNEGDLNIEDLDYIAYANSNGTFTQTSAGTTSGYGILKQIGTVNMGGTFETSGSDPEHISLEVGGGSTTFDLSNSTFNLRAAGTAGKGVAGGHDYVNILGSADLAGSIFNISFEGGYVPSNGDSFEFFNVSNTITGIPTFNLPVPPSGSTYEMVNIGGSYYLEVNSAPFPVELLSFDGELQGNNTLLTWVTATEQNNSGFNIQRSSDALIWENIGFVNGAGTTTEIQTYSFLDQRTNEGRNLYRLQQWDLDGQVNYSNVVELFVTKDLQAALKIYPVPASNTITVEGVPGTIRLLNNLGQTMAVRVSDGSPSEFIVADLPDGLYYLQVETVEHEIVFARWQKS